MASAIFKEIKTIRFYTINIILIWTLLIGLSLLWNFHTENIKLAENARIHAEVALKKDITFRKWISDRKGVYAKISDITVPNEYLKVPERDIKTVNGLKLTLINPALMTRQIHEMQKNEDGILGHITSLKPIRPANFPDDWEKSALEIFEMNKSLKEISSLERINNREYMRLMIPLTAEKSCLSCHSVHGYMEGDIRGGISIAVPINPLKEVDARFIHRMLLGHFLLWIVILFGIVFVSRDIIKRTRVRQKIQDTLKVKETIIDLSSNAIVLTDRDGAIIYSNNSFLKMWRFAGQNVIHGTSLLSFLKLKEDMEIIMTIKDIGSWTGELIAIRNDGTEFNVLLSASLLSEDNSDAHEIAFSFSDITMRKKAEMSLKENEEKLRKRNQFIERDLNLAQLAQREMIIRDIPLSDFLNIDYRYLPMTEVGGDYFSILPCFENSISIFIGDISGHGVASALYLALVKSAIEKISAESCLIPADFLTALNKELYGNMSSFYITGIYGIFHADKNNNEIEFTYSNAGHLNPLVITTGESSKFLTLKGTVMGISGSLKYDQERVILKRGDRIFLYTDGIPETENRNKEMIGFDDELIQLFRESNAGTLSGTLDNIISEVNRHRGDAPISDDIILIGFEVK